MPVAAGVLDAIEQRAKDGTGMAMTGKAWAVASLVHVGTWLVAAEFTATGVTAQIGVWASDNINVAGTQYLSVDGLANNFTGWPNAATSQARIDITDPAARQAKTCVETDSGPK